MNRIITVNQDVTFISRFICPDCHGSVIIESTSLSSPELFSQPMPINPKEKGSGCASRMSILLNNKSETVITLSKAIPNGGFLSFRSIGVLQLSLIDIESPDCITESLSIIQQLLWQYLPIASVPYCLIFRHHFKVHAINYAMSNRLNLRYRLQLNLLYTIYRVVVDREKYFTVGNWSLAMK